MPGLDIYSLDDVENQNLIASLSEGKHIIGRGDLLNVTDKRVSRNHAVIEIANNRITLTSIHQNPCFYKAAAGKNLTVVKQNEQNELMDGDQFALLPENYWFKVKITRNNNINDNPDLSIHQDNKRPYEEDADITDSNLSLKKSKLNEDATTHNDHLASTSHAQISDFQEGENDSSHECTESATSPNLTNTDLVQNNQTVEQEILPEIKQEIDENIEIKNEDLSVEQDSIKIKEEKVDPETPAHVLNGENSGTSNDNSVKDEADKKTDNGTNSKPRRERCWYAESCFRKNPMHRSTFSHPGDDDYTSDPDDQRLNCPYGASCYRTNLDHRRQFKHSAKPAPRPPQTNTQPNNVVKQPKAKRQAKRQNNNAETPDDDYDFDDPFLNDDSSDDYQPTDEDSESDWEESEDLHESSERNRMLKEARKFTKK